jgi:hypothetical protein
VSGDTVGDSLSCKRLLGIPEKTHEGAPETPLFLFLSDWGDRFRDSRA